MTMSSAIIIGYGVDRELEGHESIEIVPQISLSQVTVGKPATFYFKSTKELKNDNLHLC